ncbi:molecular chaperone Tir [Aquimarina sp. AD10]|uniref:Molecular chaperone Tir n=1 Tax=Aquimarina aggregata TaxID=1642818 RepID=A0A162YTF8_9FLAO|nr:MULTISPECIES: molecular chaperone Tir [Aquimarina]AXT61249.1 molecular chaperone Tir [Aquimarina sp. AD10]KZS39345.1 molecular chaperone Tir [Aquimarina aggregata]RKN02134.1 molecular chaperone Tir [Aquimarina sp. AD10]
MQDHFQLVKDYLLELKYTITHENKGEGIIMISKENEGIKNMIIGVAPPILIMEQHIFNIKNKNEVVYRNLLQKNRDIVHGAFVLDETGEKVIFRDTLQVEHLDLNEVEGSLNSLGLLLSEYSDQIINYSKY